MAKRIRTPEQQERHRLEELARYRSLTRAQKRAKFDKQLKANRSAERWERRLAYDAAWREKNRKKVREASRRYWNRHRSDPAFREKRRKEFEAWYRANYGTYKWKLQESRERRMWNEKKPRRREIARFCHSEGLSVVSSRWLRQPEYEELVFEHAGRRRRDG